MATYIDIHGNNIPIVSSDPSNPIVGEMWYNTTARKLKGQATLSASWASAPTMPASKGDGGMATKGTKSAFLVWQGAPGAKNSTYSYDGSSWTGEPTTPYSASGVISFGTQTAAVGAGGQPGGGGVSTTIKWGGSSWTTSGGLPYPLLYQIGGCGPETAGISIGGWDQSSGSGGNKNDVKTFNGSTWSTEPATCPFAAYTGAHYGVNSEDCNYFGGYEPSPARNDDHVNYNGTAFTTLAVYPVPIAGIGTSGTTSLGYVWSGNYQPSSPPYTAAGNDWNGSSWTSATSYPVSMQNTQSGGSSTGVAISAGGTSPPYISTTNTFTAAGPSTVTISSS